MIASSQTLQRQGSPILLLAYLHREFPSLPQAEFHTSPIYPTRLNISVHDRVADFGAWLTALGLTDPQTIHYSGSSWLTVEGVVADVPVRLNGYGTSRDVAAFGAELVSA